jgi:hypothetical protein
MNHKHSEWFLRRRYNTLITKVILSFNRTYSLLKSLSCDWWLCFLSEVYVTWFKMYFVSEVNKMYFVHSTVTATSRFKNNSTEKTTWFSISCYASEYIKRTYWIYCTVRLDNVHGIIFRVAFLVLRLLASSHHKQ